MNGFLFVGDLFLNTTSPGRRLDKDFLSVVKEKIKFITSLSEEKNLIPIVLGQSFYKTLDLTVLTEIVPLLKDKGFYFTPSKLEWDVKKDILVKKSTLGILAATGIVNIIDYNNPLSIEINGEKHCLSMNNQGKEFKNKSGESKKNILLMRNPSLDNKESIEEIVSFEGIDAIVNSGTISSNDEYIVNNRSWKNIGPVVRLKEDSEDCKPRVFEWTPDAGFCEFVVPHSLHIMDHSALPQNLRNESLVKSDFALMMKEEMIRLEQEDDADLIETELTEILISMDASLSIKDRISDLQKEVELES